MKSLSGASFFRTFELLVGTSNPGLKADQWTIDDVRFEYAKHGFGDATHCFAIEVFTLSRPGRRGWKLMVVKEHWWDGGYKRVIKELGWSRPLDGRRFDIMTWLRARAVELQR